MKRSLILAAFLPLLVIGCRKELTCPQGEIDCGGICVDPASDPAHCGACGNTCAPTAACLGGSCAACATGATSCGDVCAVLATDPEHCGDCATACGPAQVCSTSAGVTACKATCDDGLTACGRACADLQVDRFHCGACGAACAAGQTCSAGQCVAGVQVACGATDEVVPLTAALGPAGTGRPVAAGPASLATSGGSVYSVSGYPVATLDVLARDLRTTVPLHVTTLAGSDLQAVAVHGGAVLVVNAGVNTLDVLSPEGVLLDELPVGDQQAAPNPKSIAVVGTRAFIPLSGKSDLSGQQVAVADLSGLAACLAETAPPACGTGGACDAGRHCIDGACRLRCATLDAPIDLLSVPGSLDAPGAPFPTRAVAADGRVYVALSNMKRVDDCGGFGPGWCAPAGSGKVAVIDTTAGDAVTVVDLGPACGTPSGLALQGSTLWVGCGNYAFTSAWPGRIVPVALGPSPAVGAAVDTGPVVPNGVVICGDVGYVPGMTSGQARTFDPATGALGAPVTACRPGPFGFEYVADLICTP